MNRIALAAASAALLWAGAASADAYVSQIIPMAGIAQFCPRGWMLANGQLLQIAQYRILFSLLGTTYGGDGKTTFALPNLKGGTIGPAAQPITWCIATDTGSLPPRP
jgi:microcystin-dependent protein